jgi:Heterokaryon incompatibility protein (HET)
MGSRPAVQSFAHSHTRLSAPRSIRLLSLCPSANYGADLEVKLFEVSLDHLSVNNQEYEALSYVWGARKSTQPLVCNDGLLWVTPNCESALRHLRMNDTTRLLWIDAICIDQQENKQGVEERNTQVPLMGAIYAKAARTICWLGDGTSFTNGVMRHLKSIGTCPSQRGLAKLMHFEGQRLLPESPPVSTNFSLTEPRTITEKQKAK